MIRPTLIIPALVVFAAPWSSVRQPPRAPDGSLVHAYVVDTGVRRTHHDFGGRVEWIGDFVGGDPASPNADDCDPPRSGGHGTHVASLLGGRVYGVAPGVAIHALRILPCDGTDRADYDATVRAVEWVTAHAQRPAVANLSPARWSTPDTRLDRAIEGSIRAGITWVLSAGGVGNVAAYSPQRVAGAIVVAATSEKNVSTGVDYGPSLTLFARGIDVEAAGSASDSAVFTGSGDSFAAPRVAGAVALYLEAHPHATPDDVKQAAINSAVRDLVQNAGTAPNRLLQTNRR
jgi:subtilisin family serine protease